MQNFQYYTPTRVVFGRDTQKQTGALVRELGGSKVLVHFGGGSVVRSGLLDQVYASLTEAGISYVSLGGVQPNPRLSLVRQGIALCKEEQVDFILAVGGGSVLDSSKAISYGLCYDGDVWDFYCGKAQVQASTPVGAVLTIAAAGSEMSNSSVITNEDGWLKRGSNTDFGRCKFAVMNPELTFTLPAYQTACGCVDILMHVMERYFCGVDTMELTDSMAEALMRTVIRSARAVMCDPEDYEARAEIMWASSLAHNGLLSCGGTPGDWACHQLEHELGGMFDVAHGAGLAAVWGSWARYVYREDPARFARFAVEVLGIQGDFENVENTAQEGIDALESFFTALEMPVSIEQLGVSPTDEQIEQLAYKCCFQKTRTIGGFKKLDYEDMISIYQAARH